MNTDTSYYATALGLLLVAGGLLLMAVALPAAAQTPARVEAIFGALDTSKDKTLSLQEFEAGYADVQRAIALELRLRGQFQAVDVDHSGAIEAGEYANLVLVRQAGKTAPTLATFDANKDRKLGFTEYLAVVQRLAVSQSAPAKK